MRAAALEGALLSAQHTRPLAELRAPDAEVFGGKSASLGELISAEIPVPPGFAISTSAFHAFVASAGLEGRIASAMARVSAGDVDAINAASHSISEAMRFAHVPDEVRDEIAAGYDAIGSLAGEPQPAVAVRSSALGEDSQDATFAGQQETYLWVRGVDEVCDAVRDCWVSLYSPPAISYRARLGDAAGEPAMGVTVQLMVDAGVSGVMFTCNPVSGDPSMVAINASWGLGLAVVGGEVTPDDYLVSKITHEVVRQTVNRKHVEYEPDADGHGTISVPVADERQELACLDEDALAALVDVGRRVERYFGSHQDIEWAIARTGDLPGNLFVVQSRPVTATPKKKKADPDDPPASAMSLIMGTFGANVGKKD